MHFVQLHTQSMPNFPGTLVNRIQTIVMLEKNVDFIILDLFSLKDIVVLLPPYY